MKHTLTIFILLQLSFIISSAQNVGIGTTTPSTKLTVQDATATNLLLLSNSNAMALNVRSSLLFGGTNYTSGMIGTIGTASNAARLGFSTGYFVSGGANLLFERFSILNNGNIGINQTNPQYLLDINGAISINGNIRVTGRNSIEFGADLTKEVNAGKIGYGTITPGELDIVGGGTTSTNRIMKFWNEGGATFSGAIYMESGKLMNGNTGSTNLLPYAYGTVDVDGTILNGSGNFSITKFGTGSFGVYLANSVSYSNSTFTVTATAVSQGTSVMVNCYPGGGTPAPLIVTIVSYNGINTQDRTFSFIIYKPN